MAAKLRHSKQRDAILHYLQGTTLHPTADTIYQQLRSQQEMENISLGTVYRNLKVLEEQGLVVRVVTPQNTERYDAHVSPHPHFVCTQCGAVYDLPTHLLDVVRQDALTETTHQCTSIHLTCSGLCSNCCKNNIN
jgi:Fur family peroxide stress response transcriptional regulator